MSSSLKHCEAAGWLQRLMSRLEYYIIAWVPTIGVVLPNRLHSKIHWLFTTTSILQTASRACAGNTAPTLCQQICWQFTYWLNCKQPVWNMKLWNIVSRVCVGKGATAMLRIQAINIFPALLPSIGVTLPYDPLSTSSRLLIQILKYALIQSAIITNREHELIEEL